MAVDALPTGEVWAVGWSGTTKGAIKSLVMHYTGSACATPTSAP